MHNPMSNVVPEQVQNLPGTPLTLCEVTQDTCGNPVRIIPFGNARALAEAMLTGTPHIKGGRTSKDFQADKAQAVRLLKKMSYDEYRRLVPSREEAEYAEMENRARILSEAERISLTGTPSRDATGETVIMDLNKAQRDRVALATVFGSAVANQLLPASQRTPQMLPGSEARRVVREAEVERANRTFDRELEEHRKAPALNTEYGTIRPPGLSDAEWELVQNFRTQKDEEKRRGGKGSK